MGKHKRTFYPISYVEFLVKWGGEKESIERYPLLLRSRLRRYSVRGILYARFVARIEESKTAEVRDGQRSDSWRVSAVSEGLAGEGVDGGHSNSLAIFRSTSA